MPTQKRGTTFWCLAASAVLAAGVTATTAPANAAPGASPVAPTTQVKPLPGAGGDVRGVGSDYNQGKKLRLSQTASKKSMARSSTADRAEAADSTGDAAVGDTKTWLALDDAEGSLYKKNFTLKGIGDHIQVWVADDRAFPDASDCRNTLSMTDITDDQVANFVHEFDTNIYPKESASFSTPPSRDGSGSYAGALGLPADYYNVDADQSDDIVVLVDNVRDSNYYTPTAPDGKTYIAGFFYSTFNEYVDRNVMTIDAFDWLHRTGATPPDDSANADYQACASSLGRPGLGTSDPRLYEGTFAHEYQHLLEYYEDPDEASWVNEGLSDYAQTLVGYVDTKIPVDDPTADGHIKCFTGYQDPSFGGPENSLTNWQDQGAPEILCDYGAAYSFMEYLDGHYGEAFMSALHREDGNGLAGLDTVLDHFGSKDSAMTVLHKWAATMALDAALDKGRKLTGGSVSSYTASTLSSKINWANPQAYDTPGAPANGSDYVRLRNTKGTPMTAKRLTTLSFTGDKTMAPTPVEWTVEGDTLVSGAEANADRSIVREVAVPAAGGQLTFDANWDFEEGWDFGFVQVSTDGGKTWTSLPTEDTTSDHDPGAVGTVVSQLPGLTGTSTDWKTEHADLSPYAGKTVLLGFRTINDPGQENPGMSIRNVDAAGTALPTNTLDGWQSQSEVNPPAVAGWTVQLIGYDAMGRSWIHQVKLGAPKVTTQCHAETKIKRIKKVVRRHGHRKVIWVKRAIRVRVCHDVKTPMGKFSAYLNQKQLRAALGEQATTVAALVMQDDPNEVSTQQATYTLKVNGVTQPGGR